MKHTAKFGPRYGMKRFDGGGATSGKAAPKKPQMPPTSPSDDLIPPSMLPDRSVIPPGREFGAGAPKPKPRPPVKKAKGGSVGSASKRADGIAKKGKTRGKFV